jgi:hypothetical protein
MMTTATRPFAVPAPAVRASAATRHLLLAGPLFLATVVIQQATRAGVDPKAQPLSLLSLGEHGWIQIANFIVAGLLIIASAVGMRRVLRGGPAGTWGPALIATYGVAMLWGGVFVTDPASGFPEGPRPASPIRRRGAGTARCKRSPHP